MGNVYKLSNIDGGVKIFIEHLGSVFPDFIELFSPRTSVISKCPYFCLNGPVTPKPLVNDV